MDDDGSDSDDAVLAEPRLKYRRLGNDLTQLFHSDSLTAILANERFVAIGTEKGKVIMCDHEGNKTKDLAQLKGRVTCIEADERGEVIACSCIEGQVQVISLFEDSDVELKMKFKNAVHKLALSETYCSTGKIIIAGEKITLCERGLLGSKKSSNLAITKEVTRLDWTGDFLTWADSYEVKVFDMNSREIISIISRQSLCDDKDYSCNFTWSTRTTLVIGWADCIQICGVKQRQGSTKIEIQKIIQTDFRITSLIPIGSNEMIISSVTPRSKPSVKIIELQEGSDYLEHCDDQVTVRAYSTFTSKDYMMSVVNCDGHDLTAFVASPKDIIVATEPNDEDHVNWLLENEQYIEALDFTKHRKLTNHSYGAIGREYIRFLIETDDLELAAQKCPAFLSTAHDWEKEAFAFSSKNALRVLVPYLPTSNPQLRSSVYGEALRELVEAKQYDRYLYLIKTWPSAIFEIKQQVHLVRSELDRIQSKSKELSIALRILLEADRRYQEAFEIFMKLEDPDVFFFIENHYLYKAPWIQEGILQLMGIDAEKCSKILITYPDDFPIRRMVEVLRESTHFLHHYLHNLYIHDDESLPPEYHDLQIVLYANYDREKLLDFLKTSPYYEERDAVEICAAKGFTDERVYLLARMGKKSEALSLLLESSDTIHPSVEFCLQQNDHELWTELIDLSISKAEHVKNLLNIVGQYVSPLMIIERIPEGMEIPGLRDALQVVLHDATDRQSMWEVTETIAAIDGMSLIKRLYSSRKRGILVNSDAKIECSGCSQPLFFKKDISRRKCMVFSCGHHCHIQCAVDTSHHSQSRRNSDSSDPSRRSNSFSSSHFSFTSGTERCPKCDRY